jgi:hypothetical protein
MRRESVRQTLVPVGTEATARTATTIFVVIDGSRTATAMAALGATESELKTTVATSRQGGGAEPVLAGFHSGVRCKCTLYICRLGILIGYPGGIPYLRGESGLELASASRCVPASVSARACGMVA